MKLNPERARRALESAVASPLGLGIEEAAWGVYEVVNANMADAVRHISIERGKDPREFALVVAGGAGPLHAVAIARELGIAVVIVPRGSSVFCAAGMTMASLRHDYVQTFASPLDDAAATAASEILARMAARARETLSAEGVPAADVAVTATVDMRYIGQFHEVEVPGAGETIEAEPLAEAFHQRHDALFGHAVPGAPVEIINLRIRSEGRRPPPALKESPNAGPDPAAARTGSRTVWFAGEWLDAEILDGLRLTHGNTVLGPAVVEQPTTSILVPPGCELTCDRFSNYILRDLAASAPRGGALTATTTAGGHRGQ
jgi:N-methylhydantoinase A